MVNLLVLKDTFSIKNKNFYSLFGYQLLNNLGDSLYQFCIPWLVYDMTGSASQMTITFGFGMIPFVLSSLFGGAITDYFNRKKIMIITSFLSGVLLILGFFFTGSENTKIGLLYCLSFFLSVLNSINFGAFEASIPEHFSKEEIIKANAVNELVSLSALIGPPLASLIISLAGARFGILITAMAYLSSLFLLFASKKLEERHILKQYMKLDDIMIDLVTQTHIGMNYVVKLGSPLLLGIFISFFTNLAMGSIPLLLIYFCRDSFKLDENYVAWLFSGSAIIALFLMPIAIRKLNKLNTFNIILIMVILTGLCTIFMGLSHSYTLLILLFALFCLAQSLQNTFWRSFRQKYVPQELLCRVSSICRSVAFCAFPLGSIISAGVLKFISPHKFFMVAGISVLIVAFIANCLKKLYNPSSLADM